MRLAIPISLLLAAPFASALAQQAPQAPAIRPLGEVIARTSEPLVNVNGVRALSDGRVLINDGAGRRVMIFDPALKMLGVAADSTPSTANAYGPRPGSLLAYRADTTLFIDPASLSMLVIDPAGKIVRVMSVPRSQDAGALAGFGGIAFDGRGRLVYRSAPSIQMRTMSTAGGAPPMPEIPDSAAIVSIDLNTRQLDTVAFIKLPRVNMQTSQDDQGRFTMRSIVNPLPIVDEWGVLADGSIAIMRGRDYRLEILGADGSRASHRVNYEWQRLSDEDKVAFIDSVRVARERMAAEQAANPGRAGQVAQMGGGGGGGGQVMVFSGGPGGPGGGGPGAGGQMRAGGNAAQLTLVDPSELPDYRPAFFSGGVRPDRDGNLWIRTTRMVNGAPVYDVVSRTGEVLDRVTLPAGRTLIGFGDQGTVYLTGREGTAAYVEVARIR
jgi:hypothetical protein